MCVFVFVFVFLIPQKDQSFLEIAWQVANMETEEWY